MLDGKWIPGLGPDMAVTEAARRALEARLEVVRYHLPLAVQESDRDPEYVHKLRVGTRRAGAVLRIFAGVIDGKPLRKVKRALRSLRRAAGAARDWDVVTADLLQRRGDVPDKELAGLDFLIGYACGQRGAAQTHLLDAEVEYGLRFKELAADIVEAVGEGSNPLHPRTLRELGRVQLLDLLKELEWAGSRRLDDYEHLHQVRILGKQVRYALEVFADCFPAPLKEQYYPQIEEMQEILGLCNDSHVASIWLAELREKLKRLMPEDWKRYQPGIEALLKFHQRRLRRERQHFLKWWEQWSGNLAGLRALLSGTDGAAQAS